MEDLRLDGNRVLRENFDRETGMEHRDSIRVDGIVHQILDERESIHEKNIMEVFSPRIYRTLFLPKLFYKYKGLRIRLGLKKISGIRHAVGEIIERTDNGRGILLLPEIKGRV